MANILFLAPSNAKRQGQTKKMHLKIRELLNIDENFNDFIVVFFPELSKVVSYPVNFENLKIAMIKDLGVRANRVLMANSWSDFKSLLFTLSKKSTELRAVAMLPSFVEYVSASKDRSLSYQKNDSMMRTEKNKEYEKMKSKVIGELSMLNALGNNDYPRIIILWGTYSFTYQSKKKTQYYLYKWIKDMGEIHTCSP